MKGHRDACVFLVRGDRAVCLDRVCACVPGVKSVVRLCFR